MRRGGSVPGGCGVRGRRHGPRQSEGTSDSASASPGPSEQQPSETEPTETKPAVEPATGPVIGVKGLEVRAPERLDHHGAARHPAVRRTAGVIGSMISVFRFPNSGLFTVDELGDEEVSDLGARSRRRDDVELDGEQFYHLTGTLEPGLYAERFGTIVGDDRLSVEFEFGNGQGRAERDEIIASVLATVQVG